MELAIAEKSEVADEIVKSISQSYEKKQGHYLCSDLGLIVTWAQGSMFDLADPDYFNKDFAKWNRDHLPMRWPVKFIPNPKVAKQLNIIGELLKNVNLLYNACDIDESGEFIFFSIIEHFNKMHLPIRRVSINDNNLIKKAWDNAKDGKENYNLAMSEKARAVADQRFGYNLTRALTTQSQHQGADILLTCGRVSSVFVGIVVRKELERNCFTPSDYYSVSANLRVGDVILKGVKYQPREGDPLDDANRIINKDFAVNISTEIIGKNLTLDVINKSQKETVRPLPYDLATLQGACDRLFNYSLDKVLSVTQSLRDKKMISYNRTDSQYLSDEAFYDAPTVLNALSSVDMFQPITDLCVVDESNKSRCFDSSKINAHHAIAPSLNPSKVGELSDEEFNVYFLVVRNYLIQFMPSEIKEKVVLEFSVQLNDRTTRFKATKSRQIKAGWQILFAKEPKEAQEDNEQEEEENFNFDVDILQEGSLYHVVDAKTSIGSTTAPSLYTITSLLNAVRNTANLVTDEKIKQMLLDKDKGKKDRGGIGTAATRTPILTDLFKRKLLKKAGNKIRMTDSSLILYKSLPESITSPITTALWANQQALIQDGELSVEEFVSDVENSISGAVHEIKKGINIPDKFIHASRTEECPVCKKHSAEQKNGKHGVYWSCNTCSKSFSNHEDMPFDKNTMQRHTKDCPTCEGSVEKLRGQYGTYWKCGGSCGSFSDLNDKPFYEKCPNCQSPLKVFTPKKRKDKKEREPFISCTGYPGCTFKKTI